MEKTIKALIEYDKRGQAIIKEAEERRNEVIARLPEDKKALEDQYIQRMKERLTRFREQAQAETGKKLEEARAVFQGQLAWMQGTYEENKDAWIDGMVRRSIGG